MKLSIYRELRVNTLLAVLFLLQSCATGNSELFLPSIEKDVAQGRETAKTIAAAMGIVNDEVLSRYVRDVGQRIAAANPDQRFTYTFQIVDQFEPNAFALPGGWIFVSRGLLALTESEEELANVLGHEIIHVSGRHSARQQSQALLPTLLSVPGALVGAVIDEDLGRIINTPVNYLGGAYLASYSRKDEFEADQQGQQLSAAAGYNPAALAPILERLAQSATLETGEQRIPGFFDTHPSTPDRTARLTTDATAIQWLQKPAIAKNKVAYLNKLDGMLVGSNPAAGLFREQVFLHPELDLAMEFPKDWKTINSAQGVFATNKKQDRALMLEIEGEGDDPKTVATKYRDAFKQHYGADPTRQEELKAGEQSAYLLRYTNTANEKTTQLCFMWIAYRELIYRFIATTPASSCQALLTTAASFRAMTRNEYNSITESRLRIVAALQEETLNALAQRTGNQWDSATTAAVNGIDARQTLKQGQLLKISVEQVFQKPPAAP